MDAVWAVRNLLQGSVAGGTLLMFSDFFIHKWILLLMLQLGKNYQSEMKVQWVHSYSMQFQMAMSPTNRHKQFLKLRYAA